MVLAKVQIVYTRIKSETMHTTKICKSREVCFKSIKPIHHLIGGFAYLLLIYLVFGVYLYKMAG